MIIGSDMVVVWFTFERDALTVIESVRAIKMLLPKAALCLIEDGKAPLPSSQREILIGMEAEIIQSNFPRQGNLNGVNCVIGMLSELHQAAEHHNRRLSLKVDSDTLVLGSEWLSDHDKVDYAGFIGLGGFCVGASYCISSNLAKDMINDLELFPPHPKTEEDFEISSRAHRLLHNSGRIVRVPLDDNQVVGYNWHTCSDPSLYVENLPYQVVSVGQRGPGRTCRSERIESEALLMAKMINMRWPHQKAAGGDKYNTATGAKL